MVAPNSAFLVTALQARSNVEQLNLLNLTNRKKCYRFITRENISVMSNPTYMRMMIISIKLEKVLVVQWAQSNWLLQMTKEMTRQQTTGEINMMAIVNIATQLTDSKRIANLKKKISKEVKSERHSLSSVAELKTCTDTVDNFYISSINDTNMNGRPSYVFKTNRKMARMAINMDQKYPHKNPSQEEPEVHWLENSNIMGLP